MSNYIDKEVLKKRIAVHPDDSCAYKKEVETLRKWIDLCPTEDVAPIKHATWCQSFSYDDMWICSECTYFSRIKSKYCPRCGARMDRKA